MAKKKIKTSHYFTRTCANCGFEMANWFVQCPKCHHVWNSPNEEITQENYIPSEENLKTKQKMVRIIAQLTEEDVKIKEMSIYFSSDNGISWFSMPMLRENDYFVAEIEDIPNGATIIYYLKGLDENGIEFTEDNNSEYYYYFVGDESAKQQQKNEPVTQNSPPITKMKETPEDIPVPIKTPNQLNPSIENNQNNQIEHKKSEPQKKNDSAFIFTPLNQVKKDVNLKICPKCNSKIKKDWAVCPICGAPQRI